MSGLKSGNFCTFQVKLTAYEEDDMIIRPWRNSNATVCYVFNRKPEFIGPPDINYNLPDMDAVELYDVNATDPDTHQTLSFTITGIYRKKPVLIKYK